jgi:PAS domain S-box-containing protein
LKFTGRSLEQEIGNGWTEGVHPDDFDRCLTTYITAFDKREAFEMEYRLRHASGEYRWLLDMGTPNYNSNREFIGYIGHCFDISERKQAEQELIKAKEKAEESDRLKSAFLANMSHEIRTPMNGILGFAELLKEPKLTSEEQQEYISIIQKSGDRMLNTINDIVSISKIESGQMEVFISETNINEQVEYVYTFFKPEVEQKKIRFSFKTTMPAKEAVIKTDREKVYGILTNLVKNAVKFTNTGFIEFGYEKKGEFLEFFVKDTGIGIPKDRQEAIFDRFVQVDNRHARAFQGSGLGLSISKAYVEMLGGKIRVESEEEKGTVFYFTIPYNPEFDRKSSVENIVPAEGKNNLAKNLKILIAEDDEKSEMLITITVKSLSKVILKARTGVEAVEACRNNPDIDLILMDIEMPRMDGYEATRQIRQFNKNVTIIAQTAYALAGEKEKAIAAGCDDYIAKPFKKSTLLTLLKKYF